MISPRVSIIIPNYQHSLFLKERIESILAQSFQDFEMILLDDASTDGSVDILNEYRTHSKVAHIILNDLNTGKPFQQWKKGIDLTRGRLIWIAESDDVAKPNFLENMVRAFDRYPGLALAASRLEYIDTQGKSMGLVEETLDGLYDGINVFVKELGYRNCIRNTSSVVFDKKIGINCIDKVISCQFSGDWYFWALMSIYPGCYMYFDHSVLCLYRIHPNSLFGKLKGRKKRLANREKLKIFCDLHLNFIPLETSKKCVHSFIMLQHNIWFWLSAIPSNFNSTFKIFCRSGHRYLLGLLLALLLYDAFIKCINRLKKFLRIHGH